MEATLPKHLDSRHVWHPVSPERCRCGCMRLRALDDPSLIWESGDWEPEGHHARCLDRWCPCHVSPVHGDPEIDPLTLVLDEETDLDRTPQAAGSP